MLLNARNLVIPAAIWGKEAFSHRVTTVCALLSGRTVITGCEEGFILVWKFDEEYKVQPVLLLAGHDGAVLAVCQARQKIESNEFVSSDRDGNVLLWDSSDGRCIQRSRSHFVHTQISVHTVDFGDGLAEFLFCAGRYSEIVAISPKDLQVVVRFASRVEPDWISAFCLFGAQQKSDVIVGVTNAGFVKIWSLQSVAESKSTDYTVYEDESKQVLCANVRTLIICPYNPRSLLIVCSGAWMLFDPSDFTLICSVKSMDGEEWLGGQFVAIDKLFTWCSDGVCYLYQLPRSKLKGKAMRKVLPDKQLLSLQDPFCYCTVRVLPEEPQLTAFEPVYFYCPLHTEGTENLLFRADSSGSVCIWMLPEITDDIVVATMNQPGQPLPELFPVASTSIVKYWHQLSARPCGIAARWGKEFPDVITTLYVHSKAQLMVGCKDGSIIIVPAAMALQRQFYSVVAGCSDFFPVKVLRGHSSAVTCLLYPYEEHSRYGENNLISGGKDFSVIFWDLCSGAVLCKFCVQAGPIQTLLIPPETSNPRVDYSICSVAGDGSVALLNLKERRCVLLASRHFYPVKNIYWRTADDYLIVECEDRTVYVWQIETGHLDRVLTGLNADMVVAPLQQQRAQTMLSSSTPSSSSASSLFRAKYNFPLDFVTVKTSACDFSVILFNVESLILSLLTGEEGIRLHAGTDGVRSPTGAAGTLDRKEATSPLIENFKFSLQIAKLFLSLFFSWGLDQLLANDCLETFGLRPPDVPVSHGFVSPSGEYAFMLPREADAIRPARPKTPIVHNVLALVAVVQTLLSLKPVSLLEFQTPSRLSFKNRKLPQDLEDDSLKLKDVAEEQKLVNVLQRVKTFHYLNMPQMVDHDRYNVMRLLLLASRWMERCPQLRDAAQLFLSSELSRIGPNGRKVLIDDWAPYLPLVVSSSDSIFDIHPLSPVDTTNRFAAAAEDKVPKESANGNVKTVKTVSGEVAVELYESEIKHRQAAAVVLLALVGSEYGQEIQFSLNGFQNRQTGESFSAKNSSLAWTTAQCLLELLVHPPSVLLPPYSPLRRAAAELIGRGFAVWQPYLDVSKVILTVLGWCAENEQLGMSHDSKLPLSWRLDAYKIAQNSLWLIASACPAAFITALSTEVVRFTALSQHQAVNQVSPLIRSKQQILSIIEALFNSHFDVMQEVISSVGEIVVHCLDTALLKYKNVNELHPAIAKNPVITYSVQTRRMAFGSKNGSIIIYELRVGKSQIIQAHSKGISICSFSDDGKFLATCSCEEGKVNMWQMSQSFLGMGQSQVKCIRQFSIPADSGVGLVPSKNDRLRFVWLATKTVALVLPNGCEHRLSF